ncbi:hypothetical protein GC174_06110 [bacterium]|nr:hypothetical protein [bacterium]
MKILLRGLLMTTLLTSFGTSFNNSAAVAANKSADANIKRVDAPSRISVGKTATVTVTVTNEGYTDWADSGAMLTSRIVSGPRGRVVNKDIAPNVDCKKAKKSGDTWTFRYTITGPDTPGTYELVWQMATTKNEPFGRVSSKEKIIVD